MSGKSPRALPDEDARFRILVEAVTDYAIFMLDADGRVASWNSGAQRFKGYAAHEIMGEHFSRFYTPEDRADGLPERALATAAREGRFENEGWRLRKDGGRFWAHVIIDPIRDPSGELIGFAKVTRDLTERRAAAEELRRSEESFRLLVEGVTDYAIYMLDPGGIISSWNPGALRFKGYQGDEVIGSHFSRFYTEEDRAAGLPERALCIAREEGRFENEGWRVRKDGGRFWAHVIIDPIRLPSGELVGYAKITRDLTERREAQQALEEAREAFFQAQKLESVGRLTGGIAHDFNNLLMAVLGSLELLRRRVPEDPKTARLIDNATQAAQRGAALTQRMLAFARRQQLAVMAVDSACLFEGMADLLQRSLGPAVTIENRFPAGLPAVLADPNQLELALLNLAVNARDAMPGGGTIVASARAETVGEGEGLAPGAYVCLSVADAGEGMDEEVLARSMEPFFTTKGVGKGTGLGLSMVHGMAEQSGGRLVLKSVRGEGTTAEIWLPVAPAEAVGYVAEARPDAGEPAVEGGRPLSILIVDDDPLVLMNTGAMLEDLGHKVAEAASAVQALEMLSRIAVDLVVTDHAMPHMTGLELAEALGAEQPDLPVLLVSGFAELPEGSGEGFTHMSKPFTQAQLAEAVAALAGSRAKISRPASPEAAS